MLLTKKVFIDTSVIINANYDYKNTTMKQLVQQCKKNYLQLYFTDTSYEEIISNINVDVGKSINANKAFRDSAKILRNSTNSTCREYFVDISRKKIATELVSQLKKFISDCRLKILATNQKATKDVFKLYFEKKPPFGDGKKKSEFPDAFILLTLELYCNANRCKIYVVSSDKDMENYCKTSSNLIFIDKLSKVIELAISHDNIIKDHINKILSVNKHYKKIYKEIKTGFEKLLFYLTDQDGDVNDVDVNSIDIVDISIIKIDGNSAVLEVSTRVGFNADIEYLDLGNSYYDNEENRYIVASYASDVVSREENVIVYATIVFNLDDINVFNLMDTTIDPEIVNGIGISADEDGYPYK
jgi:predicted nucleic acid-binding protein